MPVSRLAIFLLSLAAGGCDIVLGLQPRADVTGDAGLADASTLCSNAVIDDDFSGALCPWARTPTRNNATVSIVAGSLEIAVPPTVQGYGGCTQNGLAEVGAGGLTVAVSELPTTASGFVVFHAYAPSDAFAGAYVFYRGGVLALYSHQDLAPVIAMAVGTTPQSWRIRPVDGGLFAEFSIDGEIFQPLGMVAGAAPGMIKLDLGSGTDVAEPTRSVARFDRVQFCGR